MTRATTAKLIGLLAVAVTAGCGAPAPSTPDAATTPGPGPRLVFIGNSYLYTHDVPGQVRFLTDAARVEQAAPGGYHLAEHAVDARTDGTPLATWLRTGPAADNQFDAVILQEQSQVGGFPPSDARLASLTAAVDLGTLAAARGARVVLYQTWGRVDGDPGNPASFGSFLAMQGELDRGYQFMAEHLRANGIAAQIAPVGAAFRRVFDDVAAAGADPLAAGSEFRALYEPDGSHPSPRGAYLAACVLSATITGAAPGAFADGAGLTTATSGRLRTACAAAIAEPRWAGWAQAVELPRVYAAPRGGQASWAWRALAVSADGARVLIAPDRGEARVLVRTAGGWALEARLPLPPDTAADALALSADGSLAVLGDTLEDVAYVFRRTATSWAPDGVVTTASTIGLGMSVAATVDGELIAVGLAQAIQVFAHGSGGWTEVPGLAVPGLQLALAADGARAIGVSVDGPTVWRRAPGGWVAEATLGASGDRVAIDHAGARAAVLVGADVAAEVRFYARIDQAWHADGVVTGLAGVDGTLALDPDGARAIVGARRREVAFGTGAAWTFARDGGAWRVDGLVTQADLLADGVVADGFGAACALARGATFCLELGPAFVSTMSAGVREFRVP